MSNTSLNAVSPAQLSAMMPLRDAQFHGVTSRPGTSNTEQLRENFNQFVGETFFGQMLKAMRSTVGKPAYFHGGRTEEVFQGQLDQHLAEHLTETSAAKIADPMFERQFPHLSRSPQPPSLDDLSSLRRG